MTQVSYNQHVSRSHTWDRIMFKCIGILGHPLRPRTSEISGQILDNLRARGIDAWERSKWDDESIAPLIAQSDLVIAIGGDGSMLRAARISSLSHVPVFGINAGHLGFLTEARENNWSKALDKLLSGQYWTESRMMIRAEAWHGDQCLSREDALNDVVISRGSIARSVLLEMFIDKVWATTYNADGLIVATPTGSTAYALAVGGPILPPELKNILVAPVAAHLSLERPIVLSEGSNIEIVVAPDTQADVIVTVDGQKVTNLAIGDTVIVKASDYTARFVRIRDRNYFYRSILDRLEPRIPVRREPKSKHISGDSQDVHA